MLSLQGEASLPASMFSISAACLATAALFHKHVTKRENPSIFAHQVNSAIAEACLFTAGACMLHSSLWCRVPEESNGRCSLYWYFFCLQNKQKFISYLVKVMQDPSQYGMSTSSLDWQSFCETWVFIEVTLQALSFSTPFQEHFSYFYFLVDNRVVNNPKILYSQILQQPFAAVWIVSYEKGKKSRFNFSVVIQIILSGLKRTQLTGLQLLCWNGGQTTEEVLIVKVPPQLYCSQLFWSGDQVSPG